MLRWSEATEAIHVAEVHHFYFNESNFVSLYPFVEDVKKLVEELSFIMPGAINKSCFYPRRYSSTSFYASLCSDFYMLHAVPCIYFRFPNTLSEQLIRTSQCLLWSILQFQQIFISSILGGGTPKVAVELLTLGSGNS